MLSKYYVLYKKKTTEAFYFRKYFPLRKNIFISSKNEGENKPHAVNLK